jgi:hypothetical protein
MKQALKQKVIAKSNLMAMNEIKAIKTKETMGRSFFTLTAEFLLMISALYFLIL